MAKTSAGIIAYRIKNGTLEVFLVHQGGPFWKNKDDGAWSIPKGEYELGEDPLTVALREFEEETGNQISPVNAIVLSPVKLKSGKTVTAWAIEADFEQSFISSNTFEMEWPPRSGKMQSFPEVDDARWFAAGLAIIKINPSQAPLLHQLQQILAAEI